MSNSNARSLTSKKQVNMAFMPEIDRAEARPFLKWAGGKSVLLPELIKRLPNKWGRYCEPFLGGGAFFFSLQPKNALLVDENEELINTYLSVRDNHTKLIKALSTHKYEREYYYQVRDMDKQPGFAKSSRIIRAGRFIFLNKTCFNGLYRVNSSGRFNVPFGKYTNPKILDEANLKACSKILNTAEVVCGSYELVLKKLKKNDFVYLDPPYAPLSKTSNFASYTNKGFGKAEQKKLFEFCCSMDKKGIKFMLSNSHTPELVKMYSKFNLESVYAPRAINSKGSKRGPVKEIIVRNYK